MKKWKSNTQAPHRASSGMLKMSSATTMFIYALLLVIVFHSPALSQNPSRVLLQGFWWDYRNNNYPNGYYNYLTELAPRLKGYGIDALWIPPSSKGGGGTSDVGYGIFDHYDLGDKFQRGDVRTRMGTKDEYLRMVAVMHANGIDVIQDIVLNHINGAGPLDAGSDPAFGKGGKDPNAPSSDPSDNPWKNFRYTSFSRPATDESANDYLNRNGRWPKNYQNFHRSGSNAWGHNDYGYPQHSEMFGPDICYRADATNTNGTPLSAATYGIGSIFNPAQPTDYMKQQAIQWGVWLKKQTGIDGVRLDAVKHFEWDVTEGFLWNLQHGCNLYGSKTMTANGGDNMFAVSEYIPEGGQPSINQFTGAAQYRTGTFDFNLRDAIYTMVASGNFDISTVPGAQISDPDPTTQGLLRGRTVSFINNHDTFRPQLDPSGNYTGWNVNNELRPHIDPFWAKVPAAYAIAAALDGSPQIFFEDLFNIGGTGKRYTHLPTDVNGLPVRSKVANIIWARRALDFAGGAYKVRSAEAGATPDNINETYKDVLVIERSAKAVIGVNDGSILQGYGIDTDFPKGTALKDYSGNTNFQYTIPAGGPDQRIYVQVPPASIDAMGNAVGGYVIIAPVGFDGLTFNPPQRQTTQEWELADDLGDSHEKSLGQGGRLLDWLYNKRRYVGRIFAEKGKQITLEAFPENHFCINLQIVNADETDWAVSGGSNWKDCRSVPEPGNPATSIEIKYTPLETGWFYIYLQTIQGGGQNAWVQATYTAPQVVDVASADQPIDHLPWDPKHDKNSGLTINAYPNPSATGRISADFTIGADTHVTLTLHDNFGEKVVTLEDRVLKQGTYTRELDTSRLKAGLYVFRLQIAAQIVTQTVMIGN